MCVSTKRKIRVGWYDEVFEEGQHVCLLYNDDQERLELMASYFKAGK